MSSRLPPALRRRIDRLAWRAHAFHRWAHHPLCDAYRGEVLALGRRARLCRGCAAAGLGLGAGGLAGLLLPPPPGALLWAGLAAFAAMTAAGLRRRRPGVPRGKLVTRLLPAAPGAWVLAAGLRAATPSGLLCAGLAAAGFALAVRAYRRRGPDRTPCLGCPERARPEVCSGLLPLARRERAFRRLAGRWIAGSG